mgnify:CR=1 FL=1
MEEKKFTGRDAAFDALLRMEKDKAYSNLTLDSVLKEMLKPESNILKFQQFFNIPIISMVFTSLFFYNCGEIDKKTT